MIQLVSNPIVKSLRFAIDWNIEGTPSSLSIIGSNSYQ